MIDYLDIVRQVQDVKIRVDYLEEANRHLISILDILSSGEDFQADINRSMDPAKIFAATRSQIKRLLPFEVIAFLMVDESDHSFVIRDCEPASHQSLIQDEVNRKIRDGKFAWALNWNRPVVTHAESPRYNLILRVLSTQTRIVGMFVGIAQSRDSYVSGPSLYALSLILLNAAYALENSSLYTLLDSQKKSIEFEFLRNTQEIRKAYEQAEEANAAKSKFIANMSHEVRTSLSGITGFADVLSDAGLSEEQIKYVNMIRRNGEVLLDLIDEVSDLTKIELGRLVLKSADFNPKSLARDVCELFRPRINSRSVDLICHIGEGIPDYIRGDALRFRQILLNLVENAVKFTTSGEVELYLLVVDENESRIKLHAEVRDTGIGIPEDKLHTIFEPFQNNSFVSQEYGGPGLGLTICKTLADLMNGDIWAESRIGRGSIFNFSAWFEKTGLKAGGKAEEAIPCLPAEETTNPVHILLVEDNLVNQKLSILILTKAGYHVDLADNGREAVEKYAANPDSFDLILMDLRMPKMDGIAATKTIRRLEHGIRIPIIAVTAQAMEGDRERCLEAGMDDYITKPIKKQAVLDIVKKWTCKGKNEL